MQHHWLGRAAVLLFLLAPWPAGAAPIYWQLNGEITYNPPNYPGFPYAELDQVLPVGTHVTYLITVDPAAPDLCGAPGAGLYMFPSATMSFGGHSYTGIGWIEVNNILGNCAVDNVTRLRLPGPAALSTIEFYPGPGDALPLTPPPYGRLWVGSWDPNFNGFGNCDIDVPCDFPPVDAFGDITSSAVVPAPTPEPSTFVLLAFGLAVIAARRRRSR